MTVSSQTLRGALLVTILLVIVPLRFSFLAGAGPYGADASYYYQIARHVAEGDGLRTSVSVYHEGIRELPKVTRVYPLWPLLLGTTGAVAGLQNATRYLPPFFYFLDLVLLWVLANRVAVRMFGAGGDVFASVGPVVVDCGHLVVLLLATNRLFFATTAHPYTEGLAFALAFASLLILERAPFWSGVVAGAAFLARSQMACLGAGVAVVLVIYAIRQREEWRRAIFYILGIGVALGPWYVFLIANFPLAAVNPFAGINPFFTYRETPEIAPFTAWVPAPTIEAWLRDRLPGLAVAFNPGHPESYFASWGVAAAIVPLALLRWITRLRQNRRLPERFVAAIIAAGVCLQVVLLHFHATFFVRWLFGWRHGLGLILLLMPAAIYLLQDRVRTVRWLTVTVLLFSIVTGFVQLARTAASPQPSYSAGQQALMRWLDAQQPRRTVLTTDAVYLSVASRSHYHWTLCEEPPEQTRKMLRHLPIDYVVVNERERGCRFVDGLQDVLRPAYAFGPPQERVYLLARRQPGN
jgi:hypothetical protein